MRVMALPALLAVLVGGSSEDVAAARATKSAGTVPVKIVRKGEQWIATFSPALQEAVKRHFPGYSPPRLEQFVPETRAQFKHDVKERPALPFLCVGDFDGNRLPDVGLLLQKPGNKHWMLAAFHQRTDGSFRSYRIDALGEAHGIETERSGVTSAAYIARERRGPVDYPVDGEGTTETLNLAHDGISLVIGEGYTGYVYFFRAGKYRSVSRGD